MGCKFLNEWPFIVLSYVKLTQSTNIDSDMT